MDLISLLCILPRIARQMAIASACLYENRLTLNYIGLSRLDNLM